jgi:hypothetical protein
VSGHLRGAFAAAAPALHRNLRGAFTAQSADGVGEGRQGPPSGAPITGSAPAGAGSKSGTHLTFSKVLSLVTLNKARALTFQYVT